MATHDRILSNLRSKYVDIQNNLALIDYPKIKVTVKESVDCLKTIELELDRASIWDPIQILWCNELHIR